MANYEISVESVFCASHALRLPDGALEPSHGHNWTVKVVVGSTALDAMDTVMDFHELERLVGEVTGGWSNRDLNAVEPFCVKGELAVNPSAERVAEVIGVSVAAGLGDGVKLLSVEVGEAPGCVAVYRA